MKLRYLILALTSFVFLLAFGSTVSAADKSQNEIIKEINEIAEKYDLQPVDAGDLEIDPSMKFETPEEFEQFLKEEEEVQKKAEERLKNQALLNSMIQPLAAGTKTEKNCQINLTGKICVEAKVKRNASNNITSVTGVKSYQTGVVFVITWSQISTGKKFSGKSGSAWADGQKTYGASVGPFPVGYTKKERIKVTF